MTADLRQLSQMRKKDFFKLFFSRNEIVFVKILTMHYDYASHARVYTEIV